MGKLAMAKYLAAIFIGLFFALSVRALPAFRIDSISGAPASQVVIAVRAFDFNQILSIQGTIEFDANVVQYDTVQQLTLPGMSPADFGVSQISAGRLSYSWNDPNLLGVNLPDSTVLFEMRLNIVGTGGQQSSFCFTTSPTILEVTDASFTEIMNVTYTCGELQVSGGGAPLVGSITSTHVRCFGNADGEATVSVSGGTAPYSCIWSTGDSTWTISNLVAGIYSVTITDAIGQVDTLSTLITEPDELLAAVGTADVTCFGEQTGSVSVGVTGGTAPYTYVWSSGALTDRVDSMAAGIYTVTVTDTFNCSATAFDTLNQPAELILTDTLIDVSVFVESDWIIDIRVFGGTGAYNYVWNGGSVEEDLVDVGAGTYSVTVADENGCSTTTTVTIEPVGVRQDMNSSGIMLYPNPNDGNFVVSLDGEQRNSVTSIEIQNAFGQVIYAEINRKPEQQITFTDTGLPPGVYLLRLAIDGNVYLKRFLVTD